MSTRYSLIVIFAKFAIQAARGICLRGAEGQGELGSNDLIDGGHIL